MPRKGAGTSSSSCPTVTERAGRTRSTGVYGLRLAAERFEQLRQRAEARGVEPSVLARQWVIDQLDAAEHARDQAEERWERDRYRPADYFVSATFEIDHRQIERGHEIVSARIRRPLHRRALPTSR